MIVLDLSILNQKGTPMFNSDLTANRPAAGIVGRIFIAIDAPFGIFRDTGSAWDQISSAGGADTNIYNTDGTLTSTRTVSSGGFQLVFNPQTTFFSSLTASTGASSFSVLGSNALTFAAAFSSSNIGNVYGANGAINAQNFLGNATFAQANLASAMVNVNKIDFGSGGHTVTMTQSTAPGVRAMTGVQNQIQFTGSHNGTISHAAISQNLGFYRESGSTRTLTITNAYSHLINPLDDYGSGFTFTNRWGIYQAGASDTNYFAANSLFGTTVNAGYRVDINGTARVSGIATLAANYTNIGTQLNFGPTSTGSSYSASGTGYLFAHQASTAINNPAFTLYSDGYAQTSGTSNFYGINIVTSINPSSGNANFNFFNASTSSGNKIDINTTGTYSGIIRGFFFNPTLTSVTGATIRAIETATGDVLFGTTSGSVGVGVNTSINASAILDITSTTKGFLPPRMTTTQKNAISTPASGLVVYDTTLNKLCVYTTAWETITSL